MPELKDRVTIKAGESNFISLGAAISSTGNPVTVSVDPGEVDFIEFDEDIMNLKILEGSTSNDDIGTYEIKINLNEKIDNLNR